MDEASKFRRAPSSVLAGFMAAALLAGPATVLEAAMSAEPAGTESLLRLETAAEELVRAQLRAVPGVHVHAGQLDPRLHLARCSTPLGAALGAGATIGARMIVRVSCSASRTPWAVFVPVNVESDVSVLILRQSALQGARLTAEQVAPESRRVAGLPAGYVSDVNALSHHTLNRSLPAGTVLTMDSLLADFIVRQGQQVTLVASVPGIEVRAPAKALEDGREGARVRVQNLTSLKVVEGVVDAGGLVHVTP